MKKLILSVCAVVAIVFAMPVQAAATLTYNSSPAVGWNYGTGNNYVPSNSATLTTSAGDQLALRLHQTYQQAPASNNSGVYSFALGIPYLSYDWDVTSSTGSLNGINAVLTLTDLGNGLSTTYLPLAILGVDDNWYGNGSAQNSGRFNWFFPFNGNTNDTYEATLTAYGFAGGPQTLSVFGQIGSGAGAVPEPATWALMLMGFGAIGFALRRSRRNQAIAQIA